MIDLTGTHGVLTEQICEMRKKALKIRKKRDTSESIATWLEDDYLLVGPGKALVFILNSKGCQWGLGSFGGCSMCGYSNETSDEVTATHLIEQAKKAIQIFSNKNFQAVKIFNSGSFLDSKEIPIEAQTAIFKEICKLENVSEIIIESRPEYITKKSLNRLTSIIGEEKQLEIGIGLESSNDSIRINNINKGFLFEDFSKAVKITLNEQVRVKSYVLLKPPFLTELEAIKDTYQTILDAIKIGSRSISINPLNVQNGTIVFDLWKHGLYRPVWFWSVLKVIKDVWGTIHKEGLNHSVDRILCDPSGTGTIRSVHNCYKCNKDFVRALKDYSVNQSITSLSNLSCKCYDLWEELISQEQISRDFSLSRLENAKDFL
ncbi:MAG: TIGR01210 family radical SAM protein [Asgard group archaeon]|nr:TIGR01210 family radical SAM protein [Asgard group archaeon]